MMRMWKLQNDEMKKRKQFARFVSRILREKRINVKEFARRLSWNLDRVLNLLNGEMSLDRNIKVKVALALGLEPEVRQPPGRPFTGIGFEALTDEDLDSLFELDLPDSYKY